MTNAHAALIANLANFKRRKMVGIAGMASAYAELLDIADALSDALSAPLTDEAVERAARVHFLAAGYGQWRDTGGSQTFVLTSWEGLSDEQRDFERRRMRAALEALHHGDGGGEG